MEVYHDKDHLCDFVYAFYIKDNCNEGKKNWCYLDFNVIYPNSAFYETNNMTYKECEDYFAGQRSFEV